MASIKKGQTDGLSGKLGNIVRYKWKDGKLVEYDREEMSYRDLTDD